MVLQLVLAVALILVVLLQQSKGEGLGSIGGGAQLFFTKSRGLDALLNRLTPYVAGAFLLLSVILSYVL